MGLSGSKAASNPKRKNSSASKKAKKQKRIDKKASPANINDWSSDDSADAQPAPMQDQPSAMSDSHEADAVQASADKHEAAPAGKQKKKQQGKQQSAGRKRKKSTGGTGSHGKRKSGGSAKKHAHAKHARAGDWTSDESRDVQPENIIDNLEPMSDSDADSQGGDRPGSVEHTVASSLGKQGQTQVARKKSLAQPDSSNSPAERGPNRVSPTEEEEDWGQPAATPYHEAQPAQQAKRKARLRKARASPGPAQHAAAGSEADDLMVDLEDDVPELEMEAERPSIASKAADKLSEESLLPDESASEGAGQKTKRTSKAVGAGSQDSEKEAAGHADKRQDK